MATATLGGGCFWCIEAVLSELKGIESITCGYAGGTLECPSYEAVCTGDTGHAEVVQVRFDDKVLTFEDLLTVFFHAHDPTTPNQQGNDIGTQYRSVVFYHDDLQRELTTELIESLNTQKLWPRPIVTEVCPIPTFYKAEDYHQDYFRKNPSQPYCLASIPPKLQKLKKGFSQFLK